MEDETTDRMQQREIRSGSPVSYDAEVIAHQRLSETGRELVLARENLVFRAGQLVNIAGRDHFEERSYTICSGEQDPHISILYKHIPSGRLTPRLNALAPGDRIPVSGPFGRFTVRDPSRPLVFIATGTGVAPARAFLRSHPGLRLTLYHGVRVGEDLYFREEFEGGCYIPCVSGEAGHGVQGRVTERCRNDAFPDGAHFYLCGANEMIYEVREILLDRGYDSSVVFTEEYYYRTYDS